MKPDTEIKDFGDSSVADILMVKPDFFDVEYEINPHMNRNFEVDAVEAGKQWNNLKDIYEKELGYNVHVVDPIEGLPDMVFAANQGFAYEDESGINVLPARMKYDERVGEVEPVMQDLGRQGIEVLEQPGAVFEGSGDAMTHPHDGKIWVGYGRRTEEEALDEISAATGLETEGVELLTDDFYHLDTCFEHLNDETALVYSDAIANDDLQKINNTYENILEVPENEAYSPKSEAYKMAGNAHCPDGENVIIHEEATETTRKLEENGLNVISTDTSEFMKSGGSVYCMKLQLGNV